MATDIVIRTGLDRVRYALLFEATLILLFSVGMVLLFDRGVLEMGIFNITLSTLALIVNFFYNLAFDKFDVSRGRVPTERSRRWRIVHALGFEVTMVIVGLPFIMWWMQWGLWRALTFDIAAMAAIVIYTYFFTLAYDRLFPVAQPARLQNAAP